MSGLVLVFTWVGVAMFLSAVWDAFAPVVKSIIRRVSK